MVTSQVDPNVKPVFLEKQQQFLPSNVGGLKLKRMALERDTPFCTEGLIDAQVEYVLHELRALVKPELAQMLCSFNYIHVVEAADILSRLFPTSQSALDVSDLLLKWTFIRLWGNFNCKAVFELMNLACAIAGSFVA